MDTQTVTRITLMLALTAAIVSWFTLEWARKRRPCAKLNSDGLQEATVLVRNGYHPDTIRIRAGRPVRLVFQRAEDNSCTSRVYLAEPPISRYLPPSWRPRSSSPRRWSARIFSLARRGATVAASSWSGRRPGRSVARRSEVAGARNGAMRKSPQSALFPCVAFLMDLTDRTFNSHERSE